MSPVTLPSGQVLSDADVAAIVAAQARTEAEGPVPAHVAPAAAPEPAAPQANAFQEGQLVSYSYEDPYDGGKTVKRDGIVVETVPDGGSGPQVVLALLSERTGNIPESSISAV